MKSLSNLATASEVQDIVSNLKGQTQVEAVGVEHILGKWGNGNPFVFGKLELGKFWRFSAHPLGNGQLLRCQIFI